VAEVTPVPDRRRPTLEDVARLAGVSSATVSRALGGNYPVASGTRDKIEHAVRELGYVANAHARALAGSRAGTVGLLIGDLIDPFFAFIARGVEREITSAGRLCLIAATHGDPRRELSFIDLMLEQRSEAVILVGGADPESSLAPRLARRVRSFAENSGQLVLCGRPPVGTPTAAVRFDNEGGAAAITEYLIAAGHERILFLGGPPRLSTTIDRVAGYRRALAARGVAEDPALVQTGGFGLAYGYAQMTEILQSRLTFTAVFAANDNVAAGAMRALTEHGREVPRDVSVVGYDDVPVASALTPPLTTVHVPLEELGREAGRLALAGADPGTEDPAERNVVVGTHIVIRDSVAPPR
jgi:LacI family transcriptional regulator